MSPVTDLQEYRAAIAAYALLPANIIKLRYTVDALLNDLLEREIDKVLAELSDPDRTA